MPRRWSLPEKALSQRQCLPDFQSGHRKTPEIRRCREDPERTILWSLNPQHTLVHTLFSPKHTVFAPCLAKPFSSMPFLKETQVSTGKKEGWRIINSHSHTWCGPRLQVTANTDAERTNPYVLSAGPSYTVTLREAESSKPTFPRLSPASSPNPQLLPLSPAILPLTSALTYGKQTY